MAFLTVIGCVCLDRITKLIFLNLLTFHESIPVIKNVFHFTLVYNTGIAFGLFKNLGVVFIVIPVIAVILIAAHIYMSRHDRTVGKLYIFGFSLILAGALSNLIDRLVYGYVVDFIDLRIWPVFNIADSAITVGAMIILLKCIPSFAR